LWLKSAYEKSSCHFIYSREFKGEDVLVRDVKGFTSVVSLTVSEKHSPRELLSILILNSTAELKIRSPSSS
jgi:hypothetical protein